MPLPRFAVVDVETSGLSQRRHRILQIGAVLVEADGTELDRWSTLVSQIEELGEIESGSVKPQSCFDTSFLPVSSPTVDSE